MIGVEFKSVGAGTCQWCGKEKDEVFDIVFSDKSFVGLYCRGDLMKAVTVKCEKRGVKPVAIPAAHSLGQSNGVSGGVSAGSSAAIPMAEAKK